MFVRSYGFHDVTNDRQPLPTSCRFTLMRPRRERLKISANRAIEEATRTEESPPADDCVAETSARVAFAGEIGLEVPGLEMIESQDHSDAYLEFVSLLMLRFTRVIACQSYLVAQSRSADSRACPR